MGMTSSIDVWDTNPQKDRVSKVVRIEFPYKTDWCIFSIEELKRILRCWIIGEEMKYPKKEGFLGRDMLKRVIDDIFNEKLDEVEKYLYSNTHNINNKEEKNDTI